MPKFITSSKHYLIASYFLISCLPFFNYILGKTVEQPGRLFFYEALCWLVLWSVFKGPRWFHYALIPAFLAIPIEIYLRLYFGQGISTHHLGIIAETSPKEALEFLGNKVWLLIIIF